MHNYPAVHYNYGDAVAHLVEAQARRSRVPFPIRLFVFFIDLIHVLKEISTGGCLSGGGGVKATNS